MIGGILLLVLAIYFWFGIAKEENSKSATGFVKIWKSIFGDKGYILTAKILAVFMLLASLSEFYKYFNS